jgi:chemotaxis protein MotB
MIDPDTRTADIQAITAGATASAAESATGIWLVTFVDLVLLLLAFFVMLFSMSSLDRALTDPSAAVLPTRAEMPLDSQTEPVRATHNIAGYEPARGEAAEYLAAVLRDGLDRIEALRDVTVILHGDNVYLSPPDALLAEGGDREGRMELALFLDRLDNRVIVLAQWRPDALGGRDDAWREALDRAAAAADLLREAGFSRGLVAQVRPTERPADRGLALLVTGEATGQ